MRPQPWPTRASKKLAHYKIFDIRADTLVSPRTGQEHDFYIIEAVNWVNVIALTTTGQIIMVEQYRHGSQTIELEIPGGMMDPHETDPIAAGLRELKEETGYEGSNARLIGQIYPNPAIMNNTCYTVLVENCECRHDICLDQTEDLTITLINPTEIPTLIQTGRIAHSLVVVALYYYQLSKTS